MFVLEVLRITDGATVFETRLEGRFAWVVLGRPRWMKDEKRIAFTGEDAHSVPGVFVQDFVPGRDTTATRRQLGGFDPDQPTESFAISPDGKRMVVSARSQLNEIYLAEGVLR